MFGGTGPMYRPTSMTQELSSSSDYYSSYHSVSMETTDVSAAAMNLSINGE